MAKNIMDNFKRADVTLVKGLEYQGIKGGIVFLPCVEVIEFDIIGVLLDFEGQAYFVPWGNVSCIQPADELFNS